MTAKKKGANPTHKNTKQNKSRRRTQKLKEIEYTPRAHPKLLCESILDAPDFRMWEFFLLGNTRIKRLYLKRKKPFFTIIIPTYNTPRLLKHTLKKIQAAESTDKPYQLIISQDAGDDPKDIVLAPLKIIKALKKPPKHLTELTYIKAKYNRGKGAAIYRGLVLAEGKYTIYIDADSDINPQIITDFIRVVEKFKPHVIFANKFLKQSQDTRPLFRRILSRIFQLLIQVAFDIPISDTQTGAKLFHTNILQFTAHYVLAKTILYLMRFGTSEDYLKALATEPMPSIGFEFEIMQAKFLNRLPLIIYEMPVKISGSRSSIRVKDVVSGIKNLTSRGL